MEYYKYEELQVGFKYCISRQLTRKMINDFIKITGDKHPLHTDVEYSKNAGFKDIIAHGMLTSAFASTLVGIHLPGIKALILSQSFKYLKPVYPGETLNIEGTVKRKIDALSVIIIDVEIKDQSENIVSKGEIHVKFRGRE